VVPHPHPEDGWVEWIYEPDLRGLGYELKAYLPEQIR